MILVRQLKKNNSGFLRWIMMVIILTSNPLTVKSQSADTIPDTNIRPFTLSGNLGILSEAYTVSGIDPRKPPSMGQLFLNTKFSLFGLQSGFNMIYSTDDNQLRQSVNTLHFYATWRWLTIYAGDVNPKFSKYSLNGVTLRGGLIDLNPGYLIFSATAGRSRRPVDFRDEPGFRNPSFEQWLYGARIGVGKKDRTQFSLAGVYGYDVESSITNWGIALPAENVSLTPMFNISFLDGALLLESNVTVSFFSMDVTSNEIDIGDLPGAGFLTSFFTPRSSSRVDYAGEVSARFDAGPAKISGGYERIQPGFMSLGTGPLRSDQEMYRFKPQVRLMKGMVNLEANYIRGRNNLLGTRVSTAERQQIGANANLRLSPAVNLTLSYMQMHNENNPVDMTVAGSEEVHQSHISRNFMLTPTIVYRSGAMAHTFSINSLYQILDDQSIAVISGNRKPVDFTNFTGGISYSTAFPKGISYSVSGKYLINETQNSKNTGYSFNTTTGYAFFRRKLNTSLSLGWAQNGVEYVQLINLADPLTGSYYIKRLNQQLANSSGVIEGEYVVRQWSRQYMVNISAAYRLPNGNSIRLMGKGLLNRTSENDGKNYDELHATLRYEHKF